MGTPACKRRSCSGSGALFKTLTSSFLIINIKPVKMEGENNNQVEQQPQVEETTAAVKQTAETTPVTEVTEPAADAVEAKPEGTDQVAEG